MEAKSRRMRRAQASLHRLARAGESDEEEENWSSEELIESESEEHTPPSRRKRGRLVLHAAYDDDDDDSSEAARRYKRRRRPLPEPLTGAERFQNSALALQGRRYHFPEHIEAIVEENRKAEEEMMGTVPMNDGTYYRDEDNFSGAFAQSWINDVVTRNALLKKDAFYNFLSILATRLQVEVEDTFDIEALDRYVERTKENIERRKKDAERTLVTVEAKKKQLEIMRDLRWRERVEHDVAQVRYERMAPHRALAEAANALYAEFQVRPDEDRKQEPVLRPRPGVHLIDDFLHDLRLFQLLENAVRSGRAAGLLRLARSADNRAIAARSPLYNRMTPWFQAESEEKRRALDGRASQWIFTQPQLRARFRGIFLLTYFYLERNLLRSPDDAVSSDRYQPPLQYVHAAYRWLWERMQRADPRLEQAAQEDYLDGRLFWNRMHTSLELAVRMRAIQPQVLPLLAQKHSIRQLWDWLAKDPADPLGGLQAQVGGRFTIAERIEVNLKRARESCVTQIHRLMIKIPPENNEINEAILRLARQLASTSEARANANNNPIDQYATLEELIQGMTPADADRIKRLENTVKAPVLERPDNSVIPESDVDPETDLFKEADEKFKAREAELARNTFPFSFVDESTLRDHLYYVTKNAEARKDRIPPITQLRERNVAEPGKSFERQEAEESPQRRIQRVYVRANRRALAAISGFGPYIPAEADRQSAMHEYTIQQDPGLLPAVLLAETFAVRLYQVEHAAERLSAYEADIREIEGIIANIATERSSLPDRDELLRKYIAPSVLSVQWRMRPDISGRIMINPEIKALIASAMMHVRNANPGLGEFDIDDLLREENEDFMLAFIECVVVVRNTDQLTNPVAHTATITVGNVKQFGRAAFQRIRLFRKRRVLRRDVAPPAYVTQFYYMRAGSYGSLGNSIPPTQRPFG